MAVEKGKNPRLSPFVERISADQLRRTEETMLRARKAVSRAQSLRKKCGDILEQSRRLTRNKST